MAKVSLRIYNREIEGLTEHGQLEEAIAHCRHILQTFPKHLETYRLLGKAYLEAKRYKEAVDIFQRLLVAVPDDFVSHVGMSIITDEGGKLDDSIWHMERAFEVQPSNGAIQGELQRLFGRRDGVEPPKIRLTRGALAHMYVQGELYTQAISEIRAVLGNDSRRTDMQVLLAMAYFHNNQKTEATDICSELLKRSTYCYDANRLMVEILRGDKQTNSAQEYRNRVNELDPYAAFTQGSVFKSDEVSDAAVTLERLEYAGQSVEMGANWGSSLGIGVEADTAAESSASEQPEWLRSGLASEEEPTPAPTPATEEEIPEFLRQAGWGEASGDFDESTSAFAAEVGTAEPVSQSDLPDWVKALEPAAQEHERIESQPSTPSAETPDWLHNPVGDQLSDSTAASPSAPEENQEEAPGWLQNLGERELDEPAPDEKPLTDTGWLRSLRAESAENEQLEASPEATEETPDWLKDFDNDLETPVQKAGTMPPFDQSSPQATETPSSTPTPEPESQASQPRPGLGSLGQSEQEQDDAMAWLESLAAKHGAKPEELVTDPNARSDVAPDWVDKAKEIGEEEVERVKESGPEPLSEEDRTGMWLRNLEAEDAKDQSAPEPAEAEAPTTDWQSGLADQSNYAGITSQPQEEAPLFSEQDAPDWFSGSDAAPAEETTPSVPSDQEGTPDWLRGGPSFAGSGIREAASPEDTSVPSENDSTVDLPDWLAGLDKEEGIPAGAAQDELPPWLQGESAPEVTEPTRPADWQPAAKTVNINSAGLDELAALPGIGESLAQAIIAYRETYGDFTSFNDLENVSGIGPQTIDDLREWLVDLGPEKQKVSEPTPSIPETEPTAVASEQEARPAEKTSPQEEQPLPAPRPKSVEGQRRRPEMSLGSAQTEIGRGNIAAALEIYSKLIRKGRSLEEIIRDLRDALYRYPVEVPIWQALGDAYMRANRLQEALDAYTKAEELLR